jgi:hypothetical protein
MLGNRIIATRRERPATAEALQREHDAMPRAMPLNRLNRITRARRIILARSPEKRRQEHFVDAQNGEQKPTGYG